MRHEPFFPSQRQQEEPASNFESSRVAYDKRLAEGREVSLAERRRYVERVRNRCLEALLQLEGVQHAYEKTDKDDLALLDRMVHARAIPLDPMRAHDVDVFLRMRTIVSDEAVSLIAMLESLAAYEQLMEQEHGSPQEQRDRIAQARAQHLNVLKDQWAMMN